MLDLQNTKKFKNDLKCIQKQNKDIRKLKKIVELIAKKISLPVKNRDHSLSGNWKGYRECHIEPDWLLIYKIAEEENTLYLTRTGSYSELFE